MLQRDPAGLELRADPTSLAPERMLVFEIRGSINTFATAIRRVHGLELVDEEELDSDELDKNPVAYLMVPDLLALRQLESLWRRWQSGSLGKGETPWRDVFLTLRDLRPWGPSDRVRGDEADILREEIFDRNAAELIKLEIELVYRANVETGQSSEDKVLSAITAKGGRVLSRSRIPDISYHALLVELPVSAVREIIQGAPDGVATLEPVMHIRPQSMATAIEATDFAEATELVGVGDLTLGEPIVALLDGVPVAKHPLLKSHLVIDDQFELEPATPVNHRVHGTAMASLIIHGDRNSLERPLPRKIHCVPVLGEGGKFPSERLIVDIIYTAIIAMREGSTATAPNVIIVNLSLGNKHRRFHGQLSPWARLLDRLAYHFGLLFVVSAGNCEEQFNIPGYNTSTAFSDAPANQRAIETLKGLGHILAERRLLSPAEAINSLTVGACNFDSVSSRNRSIITSDTDPYGDFLMANPSSALGPGFANAVKPDFLLPGSRERLRFLRNGAGIDVKPAPANRFAGLKVASPPTGGQENSEHYTAGTSAAAALASRTCHRIHDALEQAYGDLFLTLSNKERAVVIKALIAHPANWPFETVNLIKTTIGPIEGHHSHVKDNIRRFLGFGVVDAEESVACASDRATFWATGSLEPDKRVVIEVPVPVAINGLARPHGLSATLAWFTPTSPGRKSYRSVKLKLLDPNELGTLAVKPSPNQPDQNQTNRGTIFKRSWTGEKAPVVSSNMTISLTVQREPDQEASIDEVVPFGLAVTLTMPGVDEIYEQVRQRLGISQPIRV